MQTIPKDLMTYLVKYLLAVSTLLEAEESHRELADQRAGIRLVGAHEKAEDALEKVREVLPEGVSIFDILNEFGKLTQEAANVAAFEAR